jgi:hypothetical protein
VFQHGREDREVFIDFTVSHKEADGMFRLFSEISHHFFDRFVGVDHVID